MPPTCAHFCICPLEAFTCFCIIASRDKIRLCFQSVSLIKSVDFICRLLISFVLMMLIHKSSIMRFSRNIFFSCLKLCDNGAMSAANLKRGGLFPPTCTPSFLVSLARRVFLVKSSGGVQSLCSISLFTSTGIFLSLGEL